MQSRFLVCALLLLTEYHPIEIYYIIMFIFRTKFAGLNLDKSQHYHLGLSDEAQEGHWRYVDGSVVNRGTVGFNGGEPNGERSENFGSMWHGTYKINDIPNMVSPFICEFKGTYFT